MGPSVVFKCVKVSRGPFDSRPRHLRGELVVGSAVKGALTGALQASLVPELVFRFGHQRMAKESYCHLTDQQK